MRDSVLMNSWDSFLATLPSISSKTCAMYSAVIPGADEFCDWLFLGYSCVSLAISANFFLFLCDTPLFLERNFQSSFFRFSLRGGVGGDGLDGRR